MPEYTWWTGGRVEYLDTSDGRVAYRYWEESRRAPKTLLGIHGLGGNNDNFIALGEAFKPGVAVYAIDLTGNGDSGAPGDVAGRDVHLRNLDALSTLIRARHPDAKHYVAGYSLGAAYAPVWVVRNGRAFSGMILFAPPYRSPLRLPAHWRILFGALATIMPRRPVAIGNRSAGIVDARYRFTMSGERFVQKRTLRSLQVSADVVIAGERALRDVQVPTLIVHGGADAVARPEGARVAYHRLGAGDKTLHWVAGAQHDLYDVLSGIKRSDVSDEQRALVIRAVREWLEAH